jgi:hypothetical protein
LTAKNLQSAKSIREGDTLEEMAPSRTSLTGTYSEAEIVKDLRTIRLIHIWEDYTLYRYCINSKAYVLY